jgi:thiol-disulfide isomerase/thioredoxin
MEKSIMEKSIIEKSIIEKSIITRLTPEELFTLQSSFRDRVIVVKFGAEWCVHCKNIKPLWNELISLVPNNIVIVEIDIDESINLYVQLKAKKMVKGVPTILAFYGDVNREQWYIPDDSFSGGSEHDVRNFMNRCSMKAKTLVQ